MKAIVRKNGSCPDEMSFSCTAILLWLISISIYFRSFLLGYSYIYVLSLILCNTERDEIKVWCVRREANQVEGKTFLFLSFTFHLMERTVCAITMLMSGIICIYHVCEPAGIIVASVVVETPIYKRFDWSGPSSADGQFSGRLTREDYTPANLNLTITYTHT